MPGKLHRYIAFLRAINVGGHTVKMERLREIFADLGLREVTTFIASGNVIFESPSTDPASLEGRLEKALKASLGYEVATFVRTPAELARIVAFEPFAGDPGERHTLSVGLVKAAPPKEAAARIAALTDDLNDLRLHGRELYWLTRGRMSDSGITPRALEKALGASSTARNITTLRKLAAKYPEAG